MKAKRNVLQRIFLLSVALAITTGSLIWLQASASPALAQDPAELEILIEFEDDGIATLSVPPPPVFYVGDTFVVSIVALGVPEPGIFGSQFQVVYDTQHLLAIPDSLVPGDTLEPLIITKKDIDNGSGVASWAASRQGDLENVPGNVLLAQITLEAVGATEPPEGQTTLIDLQNVLLGRKGGIEVDIGGLVPLAIIIKDKEPESGDITGNVKVEGRAEDNQAGHSVQFFVSLVSTLTDALGDFSFFDVEFGTHTMTANSDGFLAATCTDLVHDTDPTVLADVTLLAGDIDDSGEVDITAAVAIGSIFGGPPTADIPADLNDDGIVNVLDSILMSVNFGQTSAGNPWICQP
jgi:hypothetical protein